MNMSAENVSEKGSKSFLEKAGNVLKNLAVIGLVATAVWYALA